MGNASRRLLSIVHLLHEHTIGMAPPMVLSLISVYGKNPYLILVSCLLSLRSKDTATWPVCQKLFKRAQTPSDMLALSQSELESIVYSIGFYKNKARTLHAVSRELITRFEGIVPSDEADLLSLPGVGRKTANLVRSKAFNISAICVDVHVHRIANRLGVVTTDSPEETERELEKILPVEYWGTINDLFVVWGQNVCTPIGPHCSTCAIAPLCQRTGVTTSR